MTFEELFRDFWWLMFPIFGMALAVWGMIQTDRRTRNVIDLIKSYTDQGKEPPPELLRLASQSLEDGGGASSSPPSRNPNAWTFVVFAAICAGFSVGYYFVRAEEWSWAFLIVAVTMGVLAVGALFIAAFSRKP